MNTYTKPLPDVALNQVSSIDLAIDWVGMNGIALPSFCGDQLLQLQLDISVDLPHPSAKGIHMSRLYQLAQKHLDKQQLTRNSVLSLLSAVIDSHSDTASTAAKLTIHSDLLVQRPALVSELEGWKRYPITLEASVDKRSGTSSVRLAVSVDYSSTCPCSAALARQLLQEAFLAEWQHKQPTPEAVGQWLAEHGSHATPHSQRSQALVSVALEDDQALPIKALIERIETALGTPVQTAVKRVDEQAFARLNGANLMYVEDAARRLQASLCQAFSAVNIQVFHRESLHQHDAVASISSPVLSAL